MAETKKEIGKNGEVIETIIFDNSELEALCEAHKIVEERVKKDRVRLRTEDYKRISVSLVGVLRNKGIKALIDYASNAPFRKIVKTMSVGYADFKEQEV